MSIVNKLLPRRARGETPAGRPEVSTVGSIAPRYRVIEDGESFKLRVFLPGVAREGLDLTLGDGEIVITGRREWKKPDDWIPLYREIKTGDFALTLSHDNVFDADRVTAEFKAGVLEVTLPKAEVLKPRKIEVS